MLGLCSGLTLYSQKVFNLVALCYDRLEKEKAIRQVTKFEKNNHKCCATGDKNAF